MGHSRNFLAIAVLALTACADAVNVDKRRSEMTQRERDSTIGISGLPGSSAVNQAIDISDSQAKRAAALDSASR